jgi:hypothetical protein
MVTRAQAQGKIIWAHTGFSISPARVRELLESNPALMGELSYRSGITTGDGKLAVEWRELFARHSDRLLLGSDTWINGKRCCQAAALSATET